MGRRDKGGEVENVSKSWELEDQRTGSETSEDPHSWGIAQNTEKSRQVRRGGGKNPE